MKPLSMPIIPSLTTLALVVGCGQDSGDLPSQPSPMLTAHGSSEHWSAWSEPVNLGKPVNTEFREINPSLSADGLSLYFVSNRPGGFGGNDIWVSRRESRRAAWEPPVNLGATINTAFDDGGVSLGDNGRLLFFNSNRPGGFGNADLYVARRVDKKDDLGWEPPVNLGPNVNTTEGERGPDYFAGAGGMPATLYFNRGNLAAQQADLYAAPITRDGEPLAAAELLADISAPGANDAGQSVAADGREIFFWSNRAGTSGFSDVWVSTRRTVHDKWSPPQNPGSPLNTPFAEERPSISRDGRTLLFDSERSGSVAGSQDIWMSTRTRGADSSGGDHDSDEE
jgi:hypothetical protein